MIELKEVRGRVYKVSNGTFYNEKTPDDVIHCLQSIGRNKRIRVFYGDSITGRDWMEEHDTIGYVGRSTGEVKIPLLIANSRSYGGGSILDDCIVKITIDKQEIYEHPKYNKKTLTVQNITDDNLLSMGYTHAVNDEENSNVANFKNEVSAINYISFMNGYRNKI